MSYGLEKLVLISVWLPSTMISAHPISDGRMDPIVDASHDSENSH